MDDPATLWYTALYLILFSAYVVGGIVGVLLYPRPESSSTRFLLLVMVGILFVLSAMYNPCIRQGSHPPVHGAVAQGGSTSHHSFV